MKLQPLRDAISVAQIVIAISMVALAGGASIWALLGAATLSVLAFVRPLPPEASKATTRLWTTLVIVALAGSFARAFLRAEFLDAGVDFLLLLVVQRLFNRQKTREHLQLLLLGAVFVIIGAVVNADLSFPVLLAFYLPLAMMALLLNTLLVEGERLGTRVRHDLDREGPRHLPQLVRAAAFVAVVAGIAGLVVFTVFPRFGVGVFLRGNLAEKAVSGFSDQVTLGGFGRIKTDATVIMHLEPPEDATLPKRLTWHLRGSAFDKYEGGSWAHSPDALQTPLGKLKRYHVTQVDPDPDGVDPRAGPKKVPAVELIFPKGAGRSGYHVKPVPVPGFAASTQTQSMVVTLDDLGTELLFAPSDPLAIAVTPRGAIERTNKKVRGDVDNQIRVLGKKPGPIQYEFVSRIGVPTAGELEAVGDPDVPARLLPYLQRDPDLSPEVTQLAQQITAGATTRYQKADAVLAWLRANASYTLDQPPSERVANGADPLEGFLFDTRAGHCEYFATAMAVLLREAGVPTRNVNGYYGAHYNEVGDFYVVRQADAHSWLEVHFGELGWVTFDPTPPSGRTAGDDAPWIPALSQVMDAVRDTYLEYVIDYNLSKQFAMLEQIGVEREGYRLKLKNWRPLAIGAGASAGALALLFVVLPRLRRRRRTPEHVRIYLRVLGRLRSRGHVREEHESAVRFAERLEREGAEEAAAFGEFARTYERLRFGANEPDEAAVESLREAAAQLR